MPVMNSIIVDIMNNYQQQIELYEHMLELARQQLKLVEEKSPSAEDILAERHDLMDDISSLNKQNQAQQETLCQSMGIESFSLSHLSKVLDAVLVEEMGLLLKDLGRVLQQIEVVDQSIQEHLNQQLSYRNRPRATHSSAQQAYQKGSKPQY
jgi:predicted XRE-type DNA-binding protein